MFIKLCYPSLGCLLCFCRKSPYSKKFWNYS
uniref:Uncharacterized protein n=1 Tax=Rhizophora mucronata TaxID=61149 RepID=A0A2P2J151_RHIMU